MDGGVRAETEGEGRGGGKWTSGAGEKAGGTTTGEGSAAANERGGTALLHVGREMPLLNEGPKQSNSGKHKGIRSKNAKMKINSLWELNKSKQFMINVNE